MYYNKLQAPISPMTNAATTFDYGNQTWVTGADAKILKRRQLADELSLLESEQGEFYFAFIKSRNDRTTLPQAIQSIKTQLVNL